MYDIVPSYIFEKIDIKEFNKEKFINTYYDYNYSYPEDFELLNFNNALWVKDIFIKDEYKNKGYGTRILNELKGTGKSLVLYSCFESMEYWEKQGFKNLFEYVYYFH